MGTTIEKPGEAIEPTKGKVSIPLIDRKKEALYTVYIAEQDNQDDRQQQFVSVNGKPYLIKRGVDVKNVPQGIVNVLQEAIQTIISKDEDGNDQVRNIPRFNFRIIDGPYFEEVL